MSIRKISEALKRSPSTISREIKRNSSDIEVNKGRYRRYFPIKANEKYLDRRKDCHRKTKFLEIVLDYVANQINEHWSPEQIANRNINQNIGIPSTSTIYRMIHSKKLPKTSMNNLRRKGKFKRPSETRGKFNDKGRTIRKSKYCFVTLAERKSRYYIAILVENRKSENVTPAIINALKEFPKDLVKTITFDIGKEFSEFEKIEEELSCKTYFCAPYCAWQKETNENSDGLLREFYPKGMDLSKVNINELNYNLNLLNNRPRKCIDHKTPIEELFGFLL